MVAVNSMERKHARQSNFELANGKDSRKDPISLQFWRCCPSFYHGFQGNAIHRLQHSGKGKTCDRPSAAIFATFEPPLDSKLSAKSNNATTIKATPTS
jgi:hypothetical protein